jgi:hypothetical protein
MTDDNLAAPALPAPQGAPDDSVADAISECHGAFVEYGFAIEDGNVDAQNAAERRHYAGLHALLSVATLRAQAVAGAEDTKRRTCEWREDADDEYGGLDTTCGQTFVLNEGTTADNDMRFCCYCGGVLVAIRAVAP